MPITCPMLFPKILTGREIHEALEADFVRERLNKNRLFSKLEDPRYVPNPCNIVDVTVDLTRPHVLIKDIFVNTDGVFCEITASDPYKEFLKLLTHEMDNKMLYVAPFIKRFPQENEIITFTTYYGARPAQSSIERAKEHGRDLIEYLSLNKKDFYSMKLYSYREDD
jgi:hypothetical protein